MLHETVDSCMTLEGILNLDIQNESDLFLQCETLNPPSIPLLSVHYRVMEEESEVAPNINPRSNIGDPADTANQQNLKELVEERINLIKCLINLTGMRY